MWIQKTNNIDQLLRKQFKKILCKLSRVPLLPLTSWTAKHRHIAFGTCVAAEIFLGRDFGISTCDLFPGWLRIKVANMSSSCPLMSRDSK